MSLGLVATLLLLAQLPGPCLANPDTTAILTQQIRQTFEGVDSTLLTRQRLPVEVRHIRLVRADSLCRVALSAYNASGGKAGPSEVAQAYVFALDTAAYAVVPGDDVSVYTYFDRQWRWLAGLVALD